MNIQMESNQRCCSYLVQRWHQDTTAAVVNIYLYFICRHKTLDMASLTQVITDRLSL